MHATHGGGHPRHEGYHRDFSDAEAFSRRFDDPARDGWQRPDEVIALLSIEAGMRVVDLGAGTGYFGAALSAAVGEGGQVLALDTEPSMISFMERRFARDGLENVTPLRIAQDDPSLEPGSVARILIVNTWHHISDRGAYAAKLREALAPGGFVLIVDFTRESEHGPPPEARLPPEVVVDELRAGGLEAEVIAETLPMQYAVRGARPH